MHFTEDFPISSRLIRKTFRDEQKMNPNSARNIWKLLARTRPEPEPEKPDPIPTLLPTLRKLGHCAAVSAHGRLTERPGTAATRVASRSALVTSGADLLLG